MEDEFFTVLVDEYPDCISIFTAGLNHCIIKEPEFIRYIIKLQDDEEFKSILQKYSDILECNEAFNDYTELTKRVRFKKTSNFTSISSKLSAITSVKNTSVLPLDSRHIQDLFYLDPDYKLITCDISELWVKFICKEINISEDEFNLCKSSNKSLFSDKLTFKDDLSIIKYILNGDIVTKSTNTDKLQNYISNFYANYGEKRKDYANFEEQIYLKYKDEFDAYVEEYYDKVCSTGAEVVYITNTKVIFKTPITEDDFVFDDTKEVSFGVSKMELQNKPIKFIGHFVYDKMYNENIDIGNILCGYSGEFVRESNIRGKYNVVGLPIEMVEYTTKGKPVRTNFYPIFNIRNQDDTELYPSFGYNGNELYIIDEEAFFKYCELNSYDELEQYLNKEITTIRNKDIVNIVSKCIASLFAMKCGNDITDFSFLDLITDENSDEVLYNVSKYYNNILNGFKKRVNV